MMLDTLLQAPAPLAYIGPETLLPFASAIAAIAGAIMFCWRWIRDLPSRIFGRTKTDETETTEAPAAPMSPESASADTE